MLNRSVVSVCAFSAAILSLFFVVMSGVWNVSGQLGESESVFMMGGWLLAALVFASRAAEPDYLDPISIVKAR